MYHWQVSSTVTDSYRTRSRKELAWKMQDEYIVNLELHYRELGGMCPSVAYFKFSIVSALSAVRLCYTTEHRFYMFCPYNGERLRRFCRCWFSCLF